MASDLIAQAPDTVCMRRNKVMIGFRGEEETWHQQGSQYSEIAHNGIER